MFYEVERMTKEETQEFLAEMKRQEEDFNRAMKQIEKEEAEQTKKNGFKNGNERTNREFT